MPAPDVVVRVPPAGPIDALAAFDGSSVATGLGMAMVNVEVPVFPSALAEMVTLPVAIAVTLPAAETVATPAFAVDQATTTPDIAAPLWSRTVAVNVSVSPISNELAEGETSIDVTTRGGGGVMPSSPPHETESARSAAAIATPRGVFLPTIGPSHCRHTTGSSLRLEVPR